jgi:hypothetical protein
MIQLEFLGRRHTLRRIVPVVAPSARMEGVWAVVQCDPPNHAAATDRNLGWILLVSFFTVLGVDFVLVAIDCFIGFCGYDIPRMGPARVGCRTAR